MLPNMVHTRTLLIPTTLNPLLKHNLSKCWTLATPGMDLTTSTTACFSSEITRSPRRTGSHLATTGTKPLPSTTWQPMNLKDSSNSLNGNPLNGLLVESPNNTPSLIWSKDLKLNLSSSSTLETSEKETFGLILKSPPSWPTGWAQLIIELSRCSKVKELLDPTTQM